MGHANAHEIRFLEPPNSQRGYSVKNSSDGENKNISSNTVSALRATRPNRSRKRRQQQKTHPSTKLDEAEAERCKKELNDALIKFGDRLRYNGSSAGSRMYNYMVNGAFGKGKAVRIIVHIPNDYPRAPVYLSAGSDYDEVQWKEVLARIINNFNWKAKQFHSAGEPIVTYLNYVANCWESLQSVDYRQKEQLRLRFYSSLLRKEVNI